MQITVLGVDLGKNSCSVVGLDAGGSVVFRRRMRRGRGHQTCGQEACCGAHQPRAANHRPCDDKGSRWTVPLIVV